MGFGLSASVPKVEVPKVPEVPAVPALPKAPDLAGAAAGLAGAVSAAAGGVAAGAKGALGSVAGGALGAVAKGSASLAGVAGVLAEVAVSFTGGSVDVAMEPHMVLDANASYGETNFEKGPVWIRVDLTPAKAKANGDALRLFTAGGEYDEQKEIRAFDEEHERTVDVLFKDAPMDKAYSLEVIPASGSSHFIFRDVPFGDLRTTRNRM